MAGASIHVDIKEEVWIIVWEGMDIVIWEVSEEEVLLWSTVTSEVEGLSEIEVSMDETCMVVARSDDGEIAEDFSWTGDGIELKEGICNGTLNTWDIVDDGIGIVMWGVIEYEVLLWIIVTSGVEGLSGTEVSMDETCSIATWSDDGENNEAFSWIRADIELKEGICNGTLNIWDTVDGGIGVCTEIGVIESGRCVASW